MPVILAAAFISACSSTTSNEPNLRVSNSAKNNDMSNNYYQSIDAACEQQAIKMDSFAQQSGQAAQYLASA
jgi:hypothetical protein